MFDIVLVHPEIPPNAGNVIRLAANTGARLHLVEPLGFSMDDKQLKRAGLDYHEYASVRVHANWRSCLAVLHGQRFFAVTTRGSISVFETRFQANDVFVFGSETAGLPENILQDFAPEKRLRLPMQAGNRSLNLSNAVAVTVFEAWRQLGFLGSTRGRAPT
ncbi:MAG: tRNA (cytidine(34)-2'-O)-methyltransferase [Betaproteobacteria bacterium]|nr:tRNA (cytidine(34)-2'-O)-methyltransferase [Betaproteobacteria bacterium]MSQ88861.1 tRNA (cytidine(34)-2'-O)-methyltransferase [Betaproteobacteria bacterium]